MKKAIGILCSTVFLASLGWKVVQFSFTAKPNASLIDVGYVRVSDNVVVQIKNGILSHTTSGESSVEKPIVRQVDGAMYVVASLSCLLAGITLLKK
jgi:hypothetical protein